MVFCKEGRGSSIPTRNGFSLPEALIAIVIAAILAVALTRVANNTRMNAGKIQELVRMTSLNDALVSQIAPRELGVTHGRTGQFSWQIAVTPLRFSATAVRVNTEVVADPAAPKVLGLGALSEGSPQAKKADEGPKWLPVYVTVTTNSPTGRRFSIDTISMVRLPKQTET